MVSHASAAATALLACQNPILLSSEEYHQSAFKRCRLLGCVAMATRQGLCLNHFVDLHERNSSHQVMQMQLPPCHFERSLLSYLSAEDKAQCSSPQQQQQPMYTTTPPARPRQATAYQLMQIGSPCDHDILLSASDLSMSPAKKMFSALHCRSSPTSWRDVPSSKKPVDPMVLTTQPKRSPKCSNNGQCRHADCTNTARRKGLCIKHGGRHFCKMPGCEKCAHRGGFCIAHGGGRRCAVADCTKSAQSGGVCYSHGGGKRCAMDQCSQAARSGGYCIQHGKLVKNRVGGLQRAHSME